MDLVARGAKFAVCVRMKGFKKVRRCGSGFNAHQKIMESANTDCRWRPVRAAWDIQDKVRLTMVLLTCKMLVAHQTAQASFGLRPSTVR